MDVRIGTSGYSYKAWKGPFYPQDIKDADMLGFYATRLSTVEINNTFYRMPVVSSVERWAEQVPGGFRFVLKAPQRITHQKRLHDCADSVSYFLKTAAVMGPKLGPLLFQLPPYFKKDAARLRDFLASLPPGTRAAFEFRHETWFDEETHGVLRDGGAALCLADTDESEPSPAFVATAPWGYLRLRRSDYADADLKAWAARVRSQDWQEAYVFFKHEDEGKGPLLAERFRGLLTDNHAGAR